MFIRHLRGSFFIAAAFMALALVRAEVREEAILPSVTDAAITRWNSPHRTFRNPAVTARDELVVFLPGTGATTGDQQQFARTAADLGFPVIYLMYSNDVAAAECQNDEDETTFEKFRREIITGVDLDPRVKVGPADGIEHRLLVLVQWLARNRPDEKWGRFLEGDSLAWRKVILAGHSQGGGHAQLMAKDHEVARVVQLGSPKDYNQKHGRPARWYGGGATPARRMFAFVHEQDTQACSYAQQLENLRVSGLTTLADTDKVAPPYNHAQILTTNYPGKSINSASAHLMLVFDFMLPRAPVSYRPVWSYLLTEPVE